MGHYTALETKDILFHIAHKVIPSVYILLLSPCFGFEDCGYGSLGSGDALRQKLCSLLCGLG